MKRLQLLCALILSATGSANLVITEVMSSSTHSDPLRNGDWWELTNTGATAVNLANYSWDDSTPLAGTVKFNAGLAIQPGESIVILDEADATAFKAAWGLGGTNPVTSQPYQVLVTSHFTAALGFPGLSSTGADGVYLFNASNVQVEMAAYATASSAGLSRAWFTDDTAVAGEFSVLGQFGAVKSTDVVPDTGSPGYAIAQPANVPPVFVGDDRTFWFTSYDLVNSVFRMQAVDSNAGQTVSYTVLSKPSWLTVSPDGTGKLRLSGTPNATQFGDFSFTLRATDNAAGGALSTENTFTLTVFPPTGPILLNEYNAVGSNEVLQSGTTTIVYGSDTHFGAITGNGGDWFELAVTGTGAAGSTVDLRGWKIEILSGGATKTLVLSSDPYWSNVMAGTLLTFIENNTAEGGLDTVIHKVSSRNSTGYAWSNIWIRDPVFIDQAASDIGSGISIDSSNTWFTIKNPAGTVVLGPCGEGIASEDLSLDGFPDTLISVSSNEVLALRSDPAPTVDPLLGRYTDQSLSSFGSPNYWSSWTKSQSFAAYLTTNTPPQITSTPVRYATGAYSYAITATDPNGTVPVVSAGTLPSFLTFTGGAGGGTIANNRPLTLADAGEYIIRVQASDATTSTPQAFVLTVLNPSPSVILNEYNAVDTGRFLNGGTLGADLGGGAAADQHFGRVDGNGGDWFELVVTGTGGVGTVDLRGWRIEIGQPAGPDFTSSSTVVLSNHSDWAAVPTGTILTFIEHNTAQGGLDTGINLRNRRSTLGDSWTNIWLGDSNYLTYTDQATNGYTIIGGVVSGVAVDDLGTRLRIKNAAGQVVFGPGGEGTAPVAGVDDTEVFALQANPLPSVSPLGAANVASATYSSFGWPNSWLAASQSFASYVATPFEAWVGGFHLSDSTADGDPDGDGRSNREEYGFGGNPGLVDGPAGGDELTRVAGTVTWKYARRGDDPSLVFSHQRSVDLTGWSALIPTSVTTAPHPTLAGFVVATVTVPANSVTGREFFRAVMP